MPAVSREKKPRLCCFALPCPSAYTYSTIPSYLSTHHTAESVITNPSCSVLCMSRTKSYEQQTAHISPQDLAPSSRILLPPPPRRQWHPSHFPASRDPPKTTHTIPIVEKLRPRSLKVPPYTLPLYCGQAEVRPIPSVRSFPVAAIFAIPRSHRGASLAGALAGGVGRRARKTG